MSEYIDSTVKRSVPTVREDNNGVTHVDAPAKVESDSPKSELNLYTGPKLEGGSANYEANVATKAPGNNGLGGSFNTINFGDDLDQAEKYVISSNASARQDQQENSISFDPDKDIKDEQILAEMNFADTDDHLDALEFEATMEDLA